MALQRRARRRGPIRKLLPLQGRCCGKKAFATQEAAEAALRRIEQTTEREQYPRRAYACEHGWWHLTKREVFV